MGFFLSFAGDAVTAVCRRPNEVAEMQNGFPKNCLYVACSTGYMCEYSYAYNGGQYICCGKTSVPIISAPNIYGKAS